MPTDFVLDLREEFCFLRTDLVPELCDPGRVELSDVEDIVDDGAERLRRGGDVLTRCSRRRCSCVRRSVGGDHLRMRRDVCVTWYTKRKTQHDKRHTDCPVSQVCEDAPVSMD